MTFARPNIGDRVSSPQGQQREYGPRTRDCRLVDGAAKVFLGALGCI